MADRYDWHPRPPSTFDRVAWLATVAVQFGLLFWPVEAGVVREYRWALILAIVAVQMLLARRLPKLRRR
jgi:hypothetical protein